ncbi:MAG: aldose 1-epimerase family protein [Bifidobacteriaceae bacterium]|jgi:aldose 1-epimerase|nr:aldose 1-epimerase family protein [Bifidobacteriaceae bacterium]
MNSTPSTHRPASGTQTIIETGPYRATIASVGATLRQLQYEGRDLVVPFAADQVRPFYRGAVLAPWPNRVIDGHYLLSGSAQQLPLTEPSRGHALHGLVGWLDFAIASQVAGGVYLVQVVEAQDGYPCRIGLEVSYRLDALTGLTWQVTAINLGATDAPYGTAPHPYLVAGPSRLDEWELTLPAHSFIEVEGPRLLPAGQRDVSGTAFDFLSGRPLGSGEVDHAFSDLDWDADGHASAVLRDPSGSGVVMTWDKSCPWVQVHTADQPLREYNRLGLALEPMTCPPDAFNSHQDLVWLAPDQTHQATWQIAAL